jgi:hypothetical protein
MRVVEIVAGLAVIGFIGWGFAAIDGIERKKWEKFATAHNCKVVAHMPVESFNTLDSRGNVGVGFTSAKDGWQCDDGVTYFRNK